MENNNQENQVLENQNMDNQTNEEAKEIVSNQEENNEVANQVEVANQEEEKAPYDGPTVVVNVRYDYRTLKYYNMFSMVYKRHYPLLYLALGLICLVYDVFQIITILNSGEITLSKFLMPGIFGIFVAYSFYLFINFEKSIDRNLTMHFNTTPTLTTIQAKITTEGIEVTSSKNPEEPYKYDWVYVTSIYEIPQFYYFFVGKQPIILTKDPNQIIEGDEATLKQIIEEQIKTKPYKLIDKEIVKAPITYVHKQDKADFVESVANNVEEKVEETDNAEANANEEKPEGEEK